MFSRLAWAKRSDARAASTRAFAAAARALVWLTLLDAFSASCADISSGWVLRISCTRRESRIAWSRADSASMTCARVVARFACASATAAW